MVFINSILFAFKEMLTKGHILLSVFPLIFGSKDLQSSPPLNLVTKSADTLNPQTSSYQLYKLIPLSS